MRGRGLTVGAAAMAAALLLAACGGGGASASGGDEKTITLYNAQSQEMMKLLVADFTAKTGIKVKMRNGNDSELANQIVQEGKASPADAFVTENSPSMVLVASRGLFTTIDEAAVAQVPSQYTPTDKQWVGWAARATVFAYNSQQLRAADLPASLLDLAEPQWKGKIGASVGGADFQAIVSAVLALKGEAATSAWLRGLKENAKLYRGNEAVMKAVNAGEVAGGILYHYYWYKDRAESGANSKNVELQFFGRQDPGAFLSLSGAGVLKSSKKQAAAQQFVSYLTGAQGQQVLATSKAMEYSLNPSVPLNSKLKPLPQLQAPPLDVAQLDGPKAVELMQQAGLL